MYTLYIFDVDGTLVVTKSGKAFRETADGFSVPSVPDAYKTLRSRSGEKPAHLRCCNSTECLTHSLFSLC